MKEEIIPFKKFTEGDFIHEIRRLNRVITKLSNERDNLQSQLKAKEEVIKEAREYLNFLAMTTQGIKEELIDKCEMGFVKFNKTMWGEELDEILSKGENK